MKLKQLLLKLGRLYPVSLAEDFDHPLYQTGKKEMEKEIRKVFLCLDFTEDCFEAAKKEQPDLILTHHPFFFGKKKDIYLSDPKKKILDQKINESLSCPIYSYHTNFDKAKGGMNDVLLGELSLPLSYIGDESLLRVSILEKETTTEDVLQHLLSCFSFDHLCYLDFHTPVRKIGFIAGGAGNDFSLALKEKCDLFISGDCSHHARVDMTRYHLNYIELPHECEEKGFLLGMKRALLSLDPSLDVISFAFEEYFKIWKK